MSKRSSVALGTILKQTAKVIRYPWMAGRLAALEKEKFFFDFLNPQAELGQARSIRQLSIRITDMAGSAAAGEPDINGLWSGSLYGSDVQAQVEQDKRDVRVVAVVHDLAGGTNVYHFFGVIDHGHMVAWQ